MSKPCQVLYFLTEFSCRCVRVVSRSYAYVRISVLNSMTSLGSGVISGANGSDQRNHFGLEEPFKFKHVRQ